MFIISSGDINEIEAVLLINNTTPKTILSLLSENGYKIQESNKKREQVKNYLYFDTPDRKLYNSDRVFRIRLKKEGKKKHKVTYKIPNDQGSSEEYANKREINVKFLGEPTLNNALNSFHNKHPELDIPTGLQNVVNLQKLRTVYELVDADGGIAEIAFDDITAISPYNSEIRKKLPREMELELETAPIETLDKVRKIITDFDPTIRPSKKSKYQLSLDAIDTKLSSFIK